MQFFLLAPVLATLLGSVTAAPQHSRADIQVSTSPNDGRPEVIFHIADNQVNDCGDSSFDNETSDASPSVDDCLQIAANIAGGGEWEVEAFTGEQHQLVQYGSCKFGVQPADGTFAGLNYYIGNTDIIDLIHSSIDMFASNGKVGSKGVMACNGNGVFSGGFNFNVLWGLY